MKSLAEFKRCEVGQKFEFKAHYLNGGTVERTLIRKQTNALGFSSLNKDCQNVPSWIYFDGKDCKRYFYKGWVIFLESGLASSIIEGIKKVLDNDLKTVEFYLAYRKVA